MRTMPRKDDLRLAAGEMGTCDGGAGPRDPGDEGEDDTEGRGAVTAVPLPGVTAPVSPPRDAPYADAPPVPLPVCRLAAPLPVCTLTAPLLEIS